MVFLKEQLSGSETDGQGYAAQTEEGKGEGGEEVEKDSGDSGVTIILHGLRVSQTASSCCPPQPRPLIVPTALQAMCFHGASLSKRLLISWPGMARKGMISV